MTIEALVTIIHVHTIISGLPEQFDIVKTVIRSNERMTIAQIRDKVMAEEASFSEKITTAGSVSQVTPRDKKTCTVKGCPNPRGHTNAECWLAHPELKRSFPHRSFNKSAKEVKQPTDTGSATLTSIDHKSWLVKRVVNKVSSPTLTERENNTSDIIKVFNMDSACTETIVKSTEGITHLNSGAKSTFTLADKSPVISQGTGVIRPDEKNLKVHVVESFGEYLLSVPQLYDRNIATIFHPTFGIMIADANTMSVTCNQPLGVGRYIDGLSS